MSKKIKRIFDVELRSKDEKENVVEGIACVFNKTTDMGWFTEEVDRHAFDECDMSDVILSRNHNTDNLLARTSNGSLVLEVRDTGLFQRSEIIDTTIGEDSLKQVKSGLITKQSFMFKIAPDGEEWEERNGKEHRIIKKIERLYDVALVTFPAYPQTSAYARGDSDELAEEHKALMEKRANQDKRMEEILKCSN